MVQHHDRFYINSEKGDTTIACTLSKILQCNKIVSWVLKDDQVVPAWKGHERTLKKSEK